MGGPTWLACPATLTGAALTFWLWSIDVLFDWVFVELLLPTNVNCGLKFTFLLPTQANGSFLASWSSLPFFCSASFTSGGPPPPTQPAGGWFTEMPCHR